MKGIWRIGLSGAALVLALGFVGLTFTNASWLADTPRGTPWKVAHRGIGQYAAGPGPNGCDAMQIEPPVHDFIENTLASLSQARRLGAGMLAVDLVPTADGKFAIFRDEALDCRTNGEGPVRGKTMEELKQLDIGYGYTADGGKTFPLRGKGLSAMPSLDDLLAAFPDTPLLFNLNGFTPADVDLLARTLRGSLRDMDNPRDGFSGSTTAIHRISEHFPKAWSWSVEQAKACRDDYMLTGWTGILPESCEGGTMLVTMENSFFLWGWPNRLIGRMEAEGGRIVIAPPARDNSPLGGLSLPEQIGEIPSTFNGYIWIDDMWTVGPALHPSLDKRREDEIKRAEAGLEKRRAAQ
ncbi:glycerophosphodiester phosphodiesterase [Altererythrobacter sp. CC-YST694]|uniref:glycerophosphodiester phosphodiesterase family protein n=1 Tax=Altererythrobacter sp. CC-YST694 TaxID=2755038 RepID=UPI001D011CE9|nr:glycerophosphodiester phosphodiesterase family protein [Altererythrobacter sp. CC-YST694]MCB5425302.1 glycerophosphodiester phosphodiesterase [Altererythrobacter sp. CC-YST694]